MLALGRTRCGRAALRGGKAPQSAAVSVNGLVSGGRARSQHYTVDVRWLSTWRGVRSRRRRSRPSDQPRT